jgi:L-lysine exporter family protein LysE/ArgO
MPASAALLTALSGLALGLSLIVAIGSQNAFVLRQGLLGEHVLPVVAVCAVSDALLITAGTLGPGALLNRAPWLQAVMRVLGRPARRCCAASRLRRQATRRTGAGQLSRSHTA